MKTFRKSLPVTWKSNGPEGSFRAVFSTFNVIDHDGDVTRPGAFKAGDEVIVGSFGHKSSELPVGKGVITADSQVAAVEGQFFMNTGPGRETYQTMKELGPLGEWSFIYTPTKHSYGDFEGRQVRFLDELKVFSVDPVLAGAGIDTRTTDIKSLGFAEHGEEVAALVETYLARVKERTAIRGTEGRSLSVANLASLGELAESLKNLQGELGQLLQSKSNTNELELAVLAAQRILAGLPA